MWRDVLWTDHVGWLWWRLHALPDVKRINNSDDDDVVSSNVVNYVE